MSYQEGCPAARANYFANPDVSYLDQPTGTETEDCARAIDENKVPTEPVFNLWGTLPGFGRFCVR